MANRDEILLIRADSNSRIGLGHVMRTLALAQAWIERGGAVTYAVAHLPDQVAGRLFKEGIEIVKIDAYPGSGRDVLLLMREAERLKPYAIILDGYQFDTDYQRTVFESAFASLVVDDIGHLKRYVTDFILNQNVGASPGLYPNVSENCRLLLGTEYLMMRNEFVDFPRREKSSGKAEKILVTMGGSDPDNVTSMILDAIDELNDNSLEVVVVAGSVNERYSELEARTADINCRVGIERSAENMAALMDWADLAVSAAGSTCWEMAYMGLPNLLLTLAENQTIIAENAEKNGCSVNLGWFHTTTPSDIAAKLHNLIEQFELRDGMTRSGRKLIDGYGRFRVVDALLDGKIG